MENGECVLTSLIEQGMLEKYLSAATDGPASR